MSTCIAIRIQKTTKRPIFWHFFLPKNSFLKKSVVGGTTTDCFEPIFGFLRSFWFEKYRSASWSRIGMFSELSGRSGRQSKSTKSTFFIFYQSDNYRTILHHFHWSREVLKAWNKNKFCCRRWNNFPAVKLNFFMYIR